MARRTDIAACLDQLPAKATRLRYGLHCIGQRVVVHKVKNLGFAARVEVDATVHPTPYLGVYVAHVSRRSRTAVDFTKFSETWQQLKARRDLWSCDDREAVKYLLPCSVESSRVTFLIDVANALIGTLSTIQSVPTLAYLAYRKLMSDENAVDMLLARLTGNPHFALDAMRASTDHSALQLAHQCGQIAAFLPERVNIETDDARTYTGEILQKYPVEEDPEATCWVDFALIWGDKPLPGVK